jgi:hypothetical protein
MQLVELYDRAQEMAGDLHARAGEALELAERLKELTKDAPPVRQHEGKVETRAALK